MRVIGKWMVLRPMRLEEVTWREVQTLRGLSVVPVHVHRSQRAQVQKNDEPGRAMEIEKSSRKSGGQSEGASWKRVK